MIFMVSSVQIPALMKNHTPPQSVLQFREYIYYTNNQVKVVWWSLFSKASVEKHVDTKGLIELIRTSFDAFGSSTFPSNQANTAMKNCPHKNLDIHSPASRAQSSIEDLVPQTAPLLGTRCYLRNSS